MMDEASDAGHKEQVSVVVRYVDVIQERLVNIEYTDSTDADSSITSKQYCKSPSTKSNIQSSLRTKDTLGMGLLSFAQRLSLSRRFMIFHPILIVLSLIS